MSRFLVGVSAIAILAMGGVPAHGGVLTTGDNAIDPGWPAAGAFVGIAHNNSGPAVGSLTIDGGSTAQARSVQIGSTVGSSGLGEINNGTLNLVHDPGLGFGDANLRVGEYGTGYLSVTNGGQINFSNGNALAMIGPRSTSVGTLELDNGHINMTSDPTNGAYATIQVVRDGGTGAFLVSNGSTVMLSDPAGVPGTGPVSGEGINVGRDAGSLGWMSVDDSTVSIQGTGSYFLVGRAGGTGSVEFLNGSTVTMQSTSGHADDGAGFSVGAYGDGADGTLTIDQSSLSMDGGAGSSHISVGREADSTGSAFFTGNMTNVTVASSTVANIFVGRHGFGLMAVGDGQPWNCRVVTTTILSLGRNPARSERWQS
jgi:hypothetical protein